jgi:glutamine amidotransferase
MKVAIIDYGVGNLFSLTGSLEEAARKAFSGNAACGGAKPVEIVVTSSAKELESSDKIVLPGVGAFGDAADKLEKSGLTPVIYALCGTPCKKTELDIAGGNAADCVRAQKKPLLGICLGMQLLYERSFEYGEHGGLGYIKGAVREIKPANGFKVPHMGWNGLDIKKSRCPLFKYVPDKSYVYFVHSYAGDGAGESVAAATEYGGVNLAAAVWEDNIFGTQFHPEKSGTIGLDILKAFIEL